MSTPNGLVNTGSICYFNSLVQSILSCHALVDYFKHASVENRNPLWLTVHKFITTGSNSVVEIINELKNTTTGFGNGQEDAGEGFHLLLDRMKDKEFDNIIMHRYDNDIWCSKCNSTSPISDPPSFPIVVPANWKDYIYEFVDDEKTEYTCALNQYLRHHVTRLDMTTKCGVCNIKGNCIAVTQLVYAPPVMIITKGGKFPLEFPPLLKFPNLGGHPLQMKLVALIEHTGTAAGGHYITNGIRNGKIYSMNDSNISDGTLVSTPSSYIGFYHVVL